MATYTFFNREQLTKDVHSALKAWHGIGGTSENLLESLRLVVMRRLPSAEADSHAKRLATNEILLAGIDILEALDPTSALVLRLRFPENEKIMTVAHKLNMSEHTISRLQKAAIGRLAEVIYDQEMSLREQQAQEMEAHLPPSEYTRLFGIDDAKVALATHLLQTNAPWVVTLVGIGGIGKTALADSVTRQVIREFAFDQVIWIRTEPQTMSGRFLSQEHTYEAIIHKLAQHFWPQTATSLTLDKHIVQVRQALKARPYLIIIDNLETDTSHLMIHLNDLANPSKILLTSRNRPDKQAHTFNFSLNELSLPAATDFIRHYSQEIGILTLAEANSEDIASIYSLTGGNPLALKLVVSLLDVLPLPQILSDLDKGQRGPAEDLYKYIYWQTWQILSKEARALLQAMPLVSESGALPDYLQKIAGLTTGQLWLAIQELRRRSLLEVRGSIQEKRYGVHRLTKAFLHTQIIRIPEEVTNVMNSE